MKSLLAALALTTACIGATAQTVQPSPTPLKPKRVRLPGEFHTNYDRFTDETRVLVGPFTVEDTSGNAPPAVRVKLSAVLAYKGEKLVEDAKQFNFVLTSSSRDWTFLRERVLYVLADGVRFAYVDDVSQREAKDGGVTEALLFTLPRKDFEKIADSAKVEMRVGTYEIALTPSHISAFFDLLEAGTLAKK